MKLLQKLIAAGAIAPPPLLDILSVIGSGENEPVSPDAAGVNRPVITQLGFKYTPSSTVNSNGFAAAAVMSATSNGVTTSKSFYRPAPAVGDIGLDEAFYILPQDEKDAVIETLISGGAFAFNHFQSAPHIAVVDRPAGLVAIWHSKVGAIVAHDPVPDDYREALEEDCRRVEDAVVEMHMQEVSSPDFVPRPYKKPRSFAREVIVGSHQEVFGRTFMNEYAFLHNTFRFAAGRDPRRRHSVKVQATLDPDAPPIAQHVHIDKTKAPKPSVTPPSLGFIQIKTVHGPYTTEVVPRPLSREQYIDSCIRRGEADTVAQEFGAVATPLQTICMVKAFGPREVDYDVAAAHRWPTVTYENGPRLSIGMVE